MENQEKSTFSEKWAQLSHNQRRFAIAMLGCASKKEAAELVGLQPNTVYGWNGIVDEVVELMTTFEADTAMDIIRGEAPKAAMVKVGGLDSDNEKIRQDAATEVLDRTLGRPTQRQEIAGADGNQLVVKVVYGTDD